MDGQQEEMGRSPATWKYGGVSYLNSRPLLDDLPALLPAGALRLDYPSLLADDLRAGRLDVALIPSVEFFRGEGYEIVSNACVAARGPVLSVKLYSRVPLPEIRTLALDRGSRTSAALVQILLAERCGVRPELSSLPLDQTLSDVRTDGVLVIGDRAMFEPAEQFVAVWDLGEEWWNWTGFPFVFAMWVARPGVAVDEIAPILQEARDRGRNRLEEIARRDAARLGLPLTTVIQYLSRNLHYEIGQAEQCGLRRFYELAVKNGLAPEGVNLVFRSVARAG